MAMYVLIEFDNDDQAMALLEKVKSKKSFRPVGLFKKPVKFCECGPMSDSQQVREITLGERFGWRVHRTCRRARKAPQAPRNLLEIERSVSERDVFLHLGPRPITVHNVSSRSE